jgi:hypothetical protein
MEVKSSITLYPTCLLWSNGQVYLRFSIQYKPTNHYGVRSTTTAHSRTSPRNKGPCVLGHNRRVCPAFLERLYEIGRSESGRAGDIGPTTGEDWKKTLEMSPTEHVEGLFE